MIRLRYGNTNTYFVNGLLIDTDMPGTLPAFYRELKQKGLSIRDVSYVIATHYHPDHIGLISELMKLGIRLILVDLQQDQVHFSDPIFKKDLRLKYQPIREADAIVISCDESRAFLQNIGISGEIIPTESHSPDGIALITDDGFCFAGDLEPMQYIEAYGGDSLLKKDWDRILACHPETACFGHINDQRIGG